MLMTFSQALELLKQGHTVTRELWIRNSYIALNKGFVSPSYWVNMDLQYIDEKFFDVDNEDDAPIAMLPYIALYHGPIVSPWQPTYIDLLAHDWKEVATLVGLRNYERENQTQ